MAARALSPYNTPMAAPQTTSLQPSLRHLRRLSDEVGVREHARHAVPRPEHGYCLDDNARAVLVLSELSGEQDNAATARLFDRCLSFVLAAQAADGRFRNRYSHDHRWVDEPATGDHWGRALWALGHVATRHREHTLTARARTGFLAGARLRSRHHRSMAYAALGGAAFLGTASGDTEQHVVRLLLADAIDVIGPPALDPDWPWPARRLTYANARVPEALIAAGVALDDESTLENGLLLLRWLVGTETRGGHLSFTPVGGKARGTPGPAFDQQPIEAWALADAAVRAFNVTNDGYWRSVVERCAAWFLGDNDSEVPLLNAATGGGCDGLEADGRNENQGAESTLALVAVLSAHARVGDRGHPLVRPH